MQGQSLVPLIMGKESTHATAAASTSTSTSTSTGTGTGTASGNFSYAFSQIQHGAYMGLTVRTDRYRYTEWLLFDKNLGNAKPPLPNFAPHFNASDPKSGVKMVELYDHQGDDGTNMDAFENENLAAQASTNTSIAAVVQAMHEQLMEVWDGGTLPPPPVPA